MGLAHALTLFRQLVASRPVYAVKEHLAIELEFRANETVWIGIDDPGLAALLPAGAVLLDAVIAEGGLPTVRENAGFEDGKGTFSGGQIQILDDVGNSFANIVADKLTNNRALVKSTVRIYIWPFGQNLNTDRDLQYTFQVYDDSFQDNVWTLDCADIQRGLDTEIFTEQSWRMKSNLAAGDDWLAITAAQDELDGRTFTFERRENASDAAGLTVGYLWLESGDNVEIVSHTGLVWDNARGEAGFNLHQRGRFQSVDQAWDADEEKEPNNRQEIVHYPYYEEDRSNLYRLHATGFTHDGRTLEKQVDNAGVDAKWINSPALASFASNEILQVGNPSEQTALEFIESELMAFAPGVTTVDKYGRLKPVRLITSGDTSPSTVTLNERNIISYGEFKTETANVATTVGIKWGQSLLDRDLFLRPVYWFDPTAEDRNQNEEIETYTSRTYRTGFHTEGSIRRTAGAMYDRHVDPYKSLSLELDFGYRWVPLGARIHIEHDDIIDYDNGTASGAPINRDMTLIGKTVDLNNRTLQVKLAGWSDKSEDHFAASLPQLPESFFNDGNKIDIATIPGINISGGVATGNVTIDLTETYYHLGDLRLQFNSVTAINRGGFRLHCRGVLIPDCDILLGGKSVYRGGQGATAGDPIGGGSNATPGDRGYFGTAEAGGSFYADVKVVNISGNFGVPAVTRVLSRPVGYEQPSARVESHRLVLTYNDGQVEGFPADGGGSGGGGTDRSRVDFQELVDIGGGDFFPQDRQQIIDGHDGAAGGAFFEFISHAGSDLGPNAKLRTNGAAVTTPPEIINGDYSLSATDRTYMAQAAAAGGEPGVISWGIDGAGTGPIFTATNCECFNGTSISEGEPWASDSFVGRRKITDGLATTDSVRHPSFTSSPRQNMYKQCASWAYIPAGENTQVKPVSQITEFLLEAFLRSDIHVTSTSAFPSNANVGDYTITQTRADSSQANPIMFRLTNSGWEPVDWNQGDALARLHLDNYRLTGRTTVRGGATRPVDFNDGDLWHEEATEITWRLYSPPGTDQVFQDKGTRLGEELHDDPNWQRTAAGESIVIGTNDPNADPINVLNRLAAQIALALVSVDGVTGDFVLAGSQNGGQQSTALSPPPTQEFIITSATEGTVNWTHPVDDVDIDGYEIHRNGSPIQQVGKTITTFAMTDLQPETEYTIAVKAFNAGSGERSTCLTDTKTTPSAGGSGFFIELTSTGLTVAGTANGGYDNGRVISLTLNDSTQLTEEVNGSGQFSFQVGSGSISNVGKSASLYINNGDALSEAQLTFTLTNT